MAKQRVQDLKDKLAAQQRDNSAEQARLRGLLQTTADQAEAAEKAH
jgi:chromosome segregation ATPase